MKDQFLGGVISEDPFVKVEKYREITEDRRRTKKSPRARSREKIKKKKC